mgnify:CR=1 FL=1
MSQITPEDVSHLAGLARIALSEEEISKLTGELGAIVSAVESIKEVATQDVVPTSHPIPLGNVFREDVVEPSLSQESALSAAPDSAEGRFRVAAILDEE